MSRFLGTLLRKRKPNITEPPNFDKFMQFLDENSGQQLQEVTGPDGKKQIIAKRVERSPEMQSIYDSAMGAYNNALANIGELSQMSPIAGEKYDKYTQPFIDKYQNEVTKIYRNLSQQAQNQIAQKGFAGGNLEQKMQGELAQRQAESQLDAITRALQAGDVLKTNELNRQLGIQQSTLPEVYGFPQQQATSNLIGNQGALFGQRVGAQAAEQQGYDFMQSRTQNPFKDLAKMGAIAAGSYFGGPMGGMAVKQGIEGVSPSNQGAQRGFF